MSPEHDALVASAPVTDTPAPAASEASEEAPATTRLGAFELAFAVAAMEFATDEDARPISDDEPTIEMPAPRIPPGVPSPLGDSGVSSIDDSDLGVRGLAFETLPVCDLGLDLEVEFYPY